MLLILILGSCELKLAAARLVAVFVFLLSHTLVVKFLLFWLELTVVAILWLEAVFGCRSRAWLKKMVSMCVGEGLVKSNFKIRRGGGSGPLLRLTSLVIVMTVRIPSTPLVQRPPHRLWRCLLLTLQLIRCVVWVIGNE